ncbi:hypothetical protein DdX_09391 [Ditylenchus destructor]|uniref:Uncharacterized protein n=1 Tax=Ditylenchus destructor TaxID=166010 RepID=A0AAD4R358_9BILA|nr:hypothetical protein DdX_09391 [Ditylenchus destructor]
MYGQSTVEEKTIVLKSPQIIDTVSDQEKNGQRDDGQQAVSERLSTLDSLHSIESIPLSVIIPETTWKTERKRRKYTHMRYLRGIFHRYSISNEQSLTSEQKLHWP